MAMSSQWESDLYSAELPQVATEVVAYVPDCPDHLYLVGHSPVGQEQQKSGEVGEERLSKKVVLFRP